MLRCDPMSVRGGVEITPSTVAFFEGSVFDVVLENPLRNYCNCRLEICDKQVGTFLLDPVDRLTIDRPTKGAGRFEFATRVEADDIVVQSLFGDGPGMWLTARYDRTYGADGPGDVSVELNLLSLGTAPVTELKTEDLERLATAAENAVWQDYHDAFDMEHDDLMMMTTWFAKNGRPDEEAVSHLSDVDPAEVKEAMGLHRKARKRYLDRMIADAQARVQEYVRDRTASLPI